MCGPDNSNRPRGGALAVLSPFSSNLGARLRSLSADLAFHTPGSPNSVGATHARLTLSDHYDMTSLSNLHVVIHSTGDLRSSICDSGLFRQFTIPAATPSAQRQYVELPLDTPLSIEVGHDGIIGRRVSLCSGPIPSPENTVAQGIVGFNFLSHPSASF